MKEFEDNLGIHTVLKKIKIFNLQNKKNNNFLNLKNSKTI